MSFAEDEEHGRLVIQLSTRPHECITTFGGTPSSSWSDDELEHDDITSEVIAAIHSATNLREGILNDYGIVVNLPELMVPSAEELERARDDCDTMIALRDRVMDQYHLLTVVETDFRRASRTT